MDQGGTWLPSLNQLERFETAPARLRANDLVIRAYRISGDLDVDLLVDAVKRVQRRHPVLTCRTVTAGGSTFLLPGVDNWVLQSQEGVTLPDGPRTDGRADRNPRPNLPAGGCVRLGLVRDMHGTSTMALVADHSVMDARSVSILVRDLFACYRLGTGSSPSSPVSPPPWSFGQWTEWERAHIAKRGAVLAAFWRRKLDGIGPFPEVRLPRVSGSRREDASPTIFNLTIRGESKSVLESLAIERDVSQFAIASLLIKATVLALRKITSPHASETVATFGAFPNRLPRGAEESVGGFANSAVIASALNGGDTLGDAVGREAQEIFLASCHQDMPHALIVNDLDPENYGVRYWGSLDEIPRYLNLDMPSANDVALQLPDGLDITEAASARPELPRSGLRIIAARDRMGLTLEVRYDPQVYAAELMNLLCVMWTALTVTWLREPNLTMRDIITSATRTALRDIDARRRDI